MFCGNPLLIGIVVFLLVAYLVAYGSSSTTIREGLASPIANCGCATTAQDDVKAFGISQSHIGGGAKYCALSDFRGSAAEQGARCITSPGCEVQGKACVTKHFGPTGHPTYKGLGGGHCISSFGKRAMTKTPGIDQCSRWCQDDPTCKSFSYQSDNTKYCLKSTEANCSRTTTDPYPWTSYAMETFACPIDVGLAYLGDGVSYAGSNGACTVGYNDNTSWWNTNGIAYLAKIRAATVANPQGIAFGQQSNGCWHILKWDPTASGANKKTQSMYPRYFEVVRPPTIAQCDNLPSSPVYPGGVNLDGRYAEGNPLRYTGGWALRNGLGIASQCDALCSQQPECQLTGNACTSMTYTSPGRCYCSYATAPPAANPKRIIHWVGDCNQCSRSWCSDGGKVIPQKVANALYSAGSPLSTWGCENVTADSEQVSIRAQPNSQSEPKGSLARGGIFVIESLHPKCSTMTCPEGTSVRNPNTQCAAQACVAEECCIANPVCTSSICNPITQKLKGSAVSSTIVDVTSCLAAGGSGSYAYCPDNNTHYCAGPCTGTQSCPSNKGLDYNACPPGAQLTTDVPVVISNPKAAKPYLQMATPSNTLTHSSEKNANFIFRSVNHDQSNPRQPLNYTDKVIIQYAALNNGGRSVDQPDGDTPGCGWYGCRVLQAPNPTNSSLNATFDHGGDDPAVFMLMAPPAYVKDANNFNGPIYNGAPFCLQYAGTLSTGYDVNWGYTPNCGYFGCRILADHMGQRPDLGEFGWEHGGGKDVAGGGPTGYPNGPTVFTIEAPSEAGIPCKGATCTSAECCNSFETCDTFTCGETYTKKSGSITCAGATCTVNECCNANPTCSAFPCSSGYHLNSNPAGITCKESPCGTSDCCTVNPSCSSYSCPAGDHLKDNPGSIRCVGASCTDKECCGLNPKCSSFACPESDFYHTYAPLANPNVPCNSQTCTVEQCCTSTPTDNQPMVQTWPLYPQNYS